VSTEGIQWVSQQTFRAIVDRSEEGRILEEFESVLEVNNIKSMEGLSYFVFMGGPSKLKYS
jgi:hypothetical protein